MPEEWKQRKTNIWYAVKIKKKNLSQTKTVQYNLIDNESRS